MRRPPDQPEPHRGRLRRGLRLALLSLGAAAAVAAIALGGGWLDGVARRRIVRAAAAAGLELTVARLEVGLLPPSLHIRDLDLRRAGDDEPLLTAEAVDARASTAALLRGELRAAAVTIHRPVVRMPARRGDGDGGGPAAAAGRRTAWSARLGRLQVVDGTLHLPGGAFAIAGEARGIDLDAAAREDGLEFDFAAGPIRLRLGGGEEWAGRAAGRGLLGADGVRFERLRVRSADADVEAAGRLGLDGSYDVGGAADLDARLVGRLRPGLPAVEGRLHVRGRLEGRGRDLRAHGVVSAAALRLAGIDATSVGATVAWDARGLRAEAVRLEALGGRIEGEYAASPAPGGGWRHSAVGRPAGVDLDRALAALGVAAPRWSARLDGEVAVEWSRAGPPAGTADLRLRPGQEASRPPLGGEARLKFRGRRVRIEQARLRAPAAQALVQGVVDGRTGEISFVAETSRAAAVVRDYLRPWLAGGVALRLPDPLPLDGRFRAEGRLAFSAGAIEGEALLEGEDVRWEETVLGGLAAHVVAEAGRLDLREVSVQGAQGRLEGEAEIWTRAPQAGRIEARARLTDVDVAGWVERLSGRASPLAGRAHATARIVRNGCGLRGEARIAVPEPTLLGRAGQHLHAELELLPEGLRLAEAEMGYGGGRLRASGLLRPGDEPWLELEFAAVGLRPEALREGGPMPFLAGEIDADGTLAGPLRSPSLRASLRYRGPPPGAVDLGDATIEAAGPLDDLALRGEAPGHRLTLIGRLGLVRGLPAQINVRAEDLDLSLLGTLLDLPWDAERFRGRADLHAAIFGPLGSPDRMRAEARVTRLELDLDGYALRGEGPLSFGWAEGVAVLRPSRLVGEGTDLSLRGRIDRRTGAGLESSATGTFDLRLLQAIDPGLRLQGTGQAQMTVETRDGAPVYGGTLRIEGARVAHAALPAAVDDLRAAAEFRGPLLTLTELAGRVGGGTLSGAGSVRFEGLQPAAVNLDLVGNDVRVTYPRALDTVGDFHVRIEDRDGGYRIAGRVDVSRGIYRLELTGGSSLLPARARGGALAATTLQGGGVADRTEIDLSIEAPDSLFVRGQDVNIEARGALRIGGTLGTPQVSGRIDALEGGVVRFRDVRYRVVGGFVDFAEYGDIDPYFHIDAMTNVRDYEIILVLDGHLSDFTFELTSYPRLTQEEVLILLVTGKTPEEIAAEGGRQVAGEEVAAALSAPLGGNVARALGLTQVRIEPVDLNGNARLTLIKEVTPQVRVTFSDDFETAGDQVYQVEYDITRKVELIAARDDDGGVGGDFRYTTRGYSHPRPPGEAPGPAVGAVDLDGAPPGLEKDLRGKIRLKRGAPYRRSRALDSVDRLRAALLRAGYLAARCELEETDRGGSVNVLFRIAAGPRYEIRLLGGDIERDRVRRRLGEAFRHNLSGTDLLDEGRRVIEGLYRGRGNPRVEVAARRERTGTDAEALVYEVRPGPRVRVRSVTFTGNASFTARELGALMVTRPGGDGWLRMPALDEDLEALRSFYREKGYHDVRIPPARVEVDPATARADVTVAIEEGSPWRIGAIAFEGNHAFSAAQLQERIELKPGEPVNRLSLETARTEIRRHYDGAGYDEVRVAYELEGEDPGARRVVFRIEEGPHHRVGAIQVEGNTYTRPKVIWRELEMDRGDDLSRDRLLAAQRRLGRLGIFRTVDVQAEDGQAEDIPVKVEVREAPNILTSFGVGWDTESGPRGFFQIRDNNFLGRGQTLGAVVAASGISERVRLSYLEPRMFGRRIEGLLTAIWSDEDQVSFDERRIAVTVGGTRRVGPYRFLAGYTLEDVSLSNIDLLTFLDRVEDVRLGSVFGTAIRDHRDDPFNPHRGLYYSLDLRLFGAYLGSEENFLKFFGHVSYFYPVIGRSYWAQGFRIGLADPFAGSAVPISERFFAGGDSTIRGFPRDTVGPIDPVTGAPTGGNAMLILNEEFHFPIWRSLEGVVFLDLGNVYPTIRFISVGEVREVLGAGLHYRTPVGPLRLEYGRKLDRRPDESAGELFFSIGLAF